MEGAGADLHVVGLQDGAALGGPIAVQAQDQILKSAGKLGSHSGASGTGVGDACISSAPERVNRPAVRRVCPRRREEVGRWRGRRKRRTDGSAGGAAAVGICEGRGSD